MSRKLTIVRPGVPRPAPSSDELVVSFEEFVHWIRRGTIVAHLGRHAEARLLVHRLDQAGRPLPLGLALRAMSRGRVAVEDVSGERRELTAGLLARWTGEFATEPFRVSSLLRRVEGELDALEALDKFAPIALDRTASPLYLRTDLSFGVRAGGSVAHIAGVANELQRLAGPLLVLTTDDIPTMSAEVRVHRVAPQEAFWNFKELPTLLLNDAFDAAAGRLVAHKPAFVYQRYSLNNYAGIRIARRFGVPFVLEYNGSEIWMGRHWGRPLKHEALSRRIEQLNLGSADLIVVVSRAMRDEIVGRGIRPRSVLVNPNGVDPDRYRPDLESTALRRQLALEGKTVVGFIGTFGPWHGAEVLARAFAKFVADDPASAGNVRLLMIGDGARLSAVREILAGSPAFDATVFTGLVPQEQGPAYLAACDVLVSPHVPNPDGTPFFGSPTKLFEYMAMGKGIVASNLDQLGEVLEHGRTAWLVPPNDVDALAAALRRLVDSRELRTSLGSAARQEAVSKYSWREHTRRTVDRLQEIVNDSLVTVRPQKA